MAHPLIAPRSHLLKPNKKRPQEKPSRRIYNTSGHSCERSVAVLARHPIALSIVPLSRLRGDPLPVTPAALRT